MRVLIFGRRGYLAGHFLRAFSARGCTTLLSECDVTDQLAVMSDIRGFSPDLVINCVGKTHSPQHATIDGCESDAAAKAQTYAVNVMGALRVRDACAIANVPLIHLGSGCIFDGYGETPLTEDVEPNPVSYYAKTKALADQMVSRYDKALILRLRLPVSDDLHPRNTLVKLAKYAEVVDAPNSVTDVASLMDATWQLVRAGKTGIFNVVNPGPVSPYHLALLMGNEPAPINPDELNARTLAPRSNCVLSTAKLEDAGVYLPLSWTVITRHVKALQERAA